MRHYGEDGKPTRPGFEAFFEELASDAEDPVLRAAGRFYVAAGLMESVNVLALAPDLNAHRRTR